MIDNDFNELKRVAKNWSNKIANEVKLRPMCDIGELSEIVFASLFLACEDMCKVQSDILHDKISELQSLVTERQGNPNSVGWQTEKIKSELTKLKKYAKRMHEIVHSYRDYNEYQQLKNFIKNKFGSIVLREFFETHLANPINQKNIYKRK